VLRLDDSLTVASLPMIVLLAMTRLNGFANRFSGNSSDRHVRPLQERHGA
jgi:hypothetical protein